MLAAVDSGDADALLELAPQLLEKRQRQHVRALEEGGHSDKIQDLMAARGENRRRGAQEPLRWRVAS